MEITRHPTWAALYGEITLQEFINRFIPAIKLKTDVNEDVKKSFFIVEKLLIHSYYEYQFLDIAYAKALHIFE
ncbi:MAG: hypothetical protein ABIR06_09220, partial [Cyclobacteriaceae bacterium]